MLLWLSINIEVKKSKQAFKTLFWRQFTFKLSLGLANGHGTYITWLLRTRCACVRKSSCFENDSKFESCCRFKQLHCTDRFTLITPRVRNVLWATIYISTMVLAELVYIYITFLGIKLQGRKIIYIFHAAFMWVHLARFIKHRVSQFSYWQGRADKEWSWRKKMRVWPLKMKKKYC